MSVAKPTLAACAAMALATCACGISYVCSLIGCSNGARVKLDRLFSESEAANLEVTACWQTACASGRPVLPTSGQGTGRTTTLKAPGLFVDAVVWVRSGGYELELEIQVLQELGAPYSLRDGDVYEVRVAGAGGALLFEGRKSARYDDWYPNGKRCDKDPCRHISLQLP